VASGHREALRRATPLQWQARAIPGEFIGFQF
jgi:hypothetical protein